MSRWIFILVLVAVPANAKAQSIRVGYGQTVRLPLPGALAAFSLDDFYAEAGVQDETLAIFGKNSGSVHVVAIMHDGIITFEVRVLPSPPSYPPGFAPPLSAAAERENGSYESRFASRPSQSENIIDFMRREGDRSTRFHFDSTFLTVPVAGQTRFSLSSISYQIRTPERDITLLDETVVNSPLTVDGAVVRGLHVREGNLIFHAGYTSLSTFDNLILPALKEGVIGVGYRFPLGAHASLTPSFYFFPGRPASENIGQKGIVTSLVYDYEPTKNLGLLAEVGLSRGIGAAVRFHFEDADNQLSANVRYEPIQFASTSLNSLHGFYSDVAWAHTLTPRLTSDLSFTGDHYRLRSLDLTNVVSSDSFEFQLSRDWSLVSGANYGISQSHIPIGAEISSMGLPASVNFYSQHFQGGFLYQYSRNSTALLRSDEFRTTLGTQWSGFRVSGFADRQTQAPTIGFILNGDPSLAETLDKLGISATTPEEIASLLGKTAGLANQGFIQGVNINLSPMRFQAGGDLTWSTRTQSRQQVHLNFLYDREDLLQSATRTEIGTLSYSLELKNANEFFASLSLLRTNTAGSAGWQTNPLIEVSFRRQLQSVPRLVIPRRRGTIRGTVFSDDGATGTYRLGGAGFAQVEVALDDERRVRTDRDGRYTFSGVPFGSHSLEVVYHSAIPFFFTTASRVQTVVDTEVNFGIGLSSAHLSGFVRSDAGIGLLGIEVNISKGRERFSVRTDAAGEFRVGGLSLGEYEAILDTDSVPPGYSLAGLGKQRVMLDSSAPPQIVFTLRAVRNISGRVTAYNSTTQQQMPVSGIVVSLSDLSRTSVTDDMGVYLFRDLPAGIYTLTVIYERKEFKHEVVLPDTPAFPEDIQIDVGTK